jgi:hypothetical protein
LLANLCAGIVIVISRAAIAQVPPVGGYAISTMGLSGPGYEYAYQGGTARDATGRLLNSAGMVAGKSLRFDATGNFGGEDAWWFDGTSTHLIGLTGEGYDAQASGSELIFRFGGVTAMTDGGIILGQTARRSPVSTAVIGQDVWIARNGTTQLIGLTVGAYYDPLQGGNKS